MFLDFIPTVDTRTDKKMNKNLQNVSTNFKLLNRRREKEGEKEEEEEEEEEAKHVE